MDFEAIKKRLTEKLQKMDKDVLRKEIEDLNDFFAMGEHSITVSQLKEFHEERLRFQTTLAPPIPNLFTFKLKNEALNYQGFFIFESHGKAITA